ncbi:hypothetical protein BpHYR1_012769 [Brachionus plicatilis]|uniref:Uncharacterized protein n=1 Tax=Brachionus plicatilis TaxID=10195 RepID=A0A3M7STQ5_BRAPC|nr:hypothetical protein BpHYR1_012769 [Brachionus plicatilis]
MCLDKLFGNLCGFLLNLNFEVIENLETVNEKTAILPILNPVFCIKKYLTKSTGLSGVMPH